MATNSREFTPLMLNTLRNELNKAVDTVAKKHGLTISFGNATYEKLTATFKVELGFAASEDYDPEKILWEQNCTIYGLQPDDYGKDISFPGNTHHYTICGFNPKGKKNKVIILCKEDSTKYTTSVESILVALGRKEAKKDPVAAEEERQRTKMYWDLNCWRAGLQPDDYGKVIEIGATKYRISGYKENARINSIFITDDKTGKVYVTSPETVKKCLSRI